MANFQQEEFKFPDEKPAAGQEKEVQTPEFEIEIEDDTPPEDRNRKPVDKETVKKLEVEVDELDKYSVEAKDKLIKMKKVWHDERRAKEEADRERKEALKVAKKLMEENKALKSKLSSGEEEYVSAAKQNASLELDAAKKAYKEAYDAGDSDQLVEAQERLTMAKIKVDKLDNHDLVYKKPVEEFENDVQTSQEQSAPKPDKKAAKWQKRNKWFGRDEEMTSLALGLHEKLKRTGVLVGSDEYYDAIDTTMRRRFPESFANEQKEKEDKSESRTEEPQKTSKPKSSTVVAPASRSTSPKKIRLSNTQVLLAKKLGLTPEQYAREITKLEAQNG